jgi:hypothetical protein
MHVYRLRGAVGDFADLVQSARIRAVGDDYFYSMYVLNNIPQKAFVDIYPQSATGPSGSGGTLIDPKDPVVQISSEISQQPVGNAPNTASLKAKFLPVGATVVLGDGSVAASAITFSPRGLPCTLVGQVCKTHIAAGDIAYWIFFQDNITQSWGAVTLTPAGRVQRWLYSGGAAADWANY